ncbi:MAG: hydroxyacid dehydrogenase [Limnochordia bacterium]
MRILVTEPIHDAGIEFLRQRAEVVLGAGRSVEELKELARDVDGIIVRVVPIDADFLKGCPQLKVVGKHGVGYDNIQVPAATEQGIAVVFTPGANSVSVAEHALALMLNLAVRVGSADRDIRGGCLGPQKNYRGVELLGKTLGLIGLGRIGRHLAHMCRAAFDMEVVAYDPYVKSAPDSIKLASLEEVLRAGDFISIHVPLTEETKDLIAAPQLAMMKETAFIINTARGGIINEEALHGALVAGEIAGAGLDVFVKEPPPADHPLVQLDNVVVTPHTGAATEEALKRMAITVSEEVLAVLEGRRPRHLVNPEVFN